ncbi:hypothetical protein EUX98_g1883 [Antrodiella citrinella]|uniref:Uncharacterized protein n=1 Tax=Antrodiella citrinella TaxID=2447956 RepID=A0A4S4N092_9APHY|nr:hypothetical protein EUX98_g1883 [Antrodiella citrinella]
MPAPEDVKCASTTTGQPSTCGWPNCACEKPASK